MSEICLYWFKRDLRVFDNFALFKAISFGDVIPIYIVEPNLWSLPDHSYRQWEFCRECILDLEKQLIDIGLKLIIRVGDAKIILEDFIDNFQVKNVFSHEGTGNYWTYQRDKGLRKSFKSKNIKWSEFQQFGVIRGVKNRDNWSSLWENFMIKPLIKPSYCNVSTLINIDELQSENKLPTSKELNLTCDNCYERQIGGRSNALKRMDLFFNHKLDKYSYSISNPKYALDGCSRLSPYISFGCISLREVVQKLRKHKKVKNALESRLHWHCHFIQKLEQKPELEFNDFHPYFSNIRNYNNSFLTAWRDGATGYPFLDACMRCLDRKGWINFRMRAMLMSFASYDLWLPWQNTGLILAKKFVDFEPGIHWMQCQMQSGTTSINSLRIYNPVKQSIDFDPNGDFIKKWVPELRNLPSTYIHEPWEIDLLIDSCYKIKLGEDYPYPIVNHKDSIKIAKKRIREVREQKGYTMISENILKKFGSRRSISNK